MDYIDITLLSHSDINPMIIISTSDNECKQDRLFTSTQYCDPIHIFLKKEQLPNREFFICTINRENTYSIDYNITIKNEYSASIPYNHQGSYYVSDTSTENMEFFFVKDDNEYNDNSRISFWVKGKNIYKADMEGYSDMGGYYKGNVYDLGYVFYGDFQKKEKKLTIGSKIGDFITIGSTVIKDGKTHEMKENSDEIMIASEEEVCLPIKYESYIMHITGKVYTRKAYTYFTDDQGNIIIIDDEIQEKNITNGILNDFNRIRLMDDNYKKGSYCLRSNSVLGDKLLIFSIQMTSNKDIHMVHSPLIPGEIRRHFLMKNEWAIFYGMKPKEGAKEVNLNLKSLRGFPEMYYDDCTSFPACFYTEDSIKELNHPYPSNMITVYSFYINDKPEYKDYNSITAFQPLMIVYCAEGGKKEFFGEDTYCEFETSYFTNLDSINLYENFGFSQYLLKEEKDNYIINLYGEDSDIIYLDMMIFSGDADIIINNFQGEANKYYLSNKIFYSIHLIKNKTENLNFTILANSPCFYTIQYQLFKIGLSDEINTIESGVNYITSKFYTNYKYILSTKHIDLINYKYEFDQDYLIDIYSPNCKFEIYWALNENDSEKIETTEDNYAQIMINNKEDIGIGKEFYTFYYSIISDDKSEFSNKFCMVYVSGLELSNSVTEWNNRAISLSEGVPHRYTFNLQYPFMFYAYHISDQEKALVINFRLIDKAYFDVEIKINMEQFITDKVYRNRIIYIDSNYLKGACIKQEVCTVNLIIQMKDSTEDKRVELTMYQIDEVPFYLEKNIVKQDVLNGNKVKHYYFEIAKEEYGDITLDFKRGSGNIYASIEERTRAEPMNQPDWRGIYHFPMTNDESLKYKTYGKKIVIEENDTKKCKNGCYVLISIASNSKYYGLYDDETATYRISINPRIMKTDPSVPSPKVKIDVNEFVIGDIVYGLPENRKYDYYTLTLPYESDFVVIDWQADAPLLLINVGDARPTTKQAHFEFPPIGSDFVYKLNRTKILEKGGYDKDLSLRGITLTIGIYSETNDSIQSSPYAFKIFMPPIASKEFQLASQIIHIRSDQKVQCLPFEFKDNQYVCMFAVIIDDIDATRNLIVYPRNQDGSTLEIYGNLTDAELVERNEQGYILALMMEIYREERYKNTERYVYLENMSRENSYFFMLHATDNSESVMEVMTSTQVYYDDVQIYPNPSTVQIFATGNKNVSLNFITTQDLLLNIVSIAGTGGFHWGDEKGAQDIYYLQGFNDRLSLTTYTGDMEMRFAPLKIFSSQFPQYENGGFIFYITYYPRSNIDQLKSERNTEFHYRTLQMPLYYYVPILFLQNYTINFNFYDFGTENKENVEYDTNLFNIWATVISESEIIKARTELNYKPKIDSSDIIKGVFDSPFGNIYLSQSEINRIYENKDDNGRLNILFAIEKSDNFKTNFSSLGFEINIFSDMKTIGFSSASEGIYITGKLSQSGDNRLVYRIPCNKDKPYVRIEYAANSDFVKFALSENYESESSDKFEESKTEKKSGRNILKIKLSDDFFKKNDSDHTLFFIVFTKERNINRKLDYFTFKYLTQERDAGYYDNIMDEKKRDLTLKIEGNNYSITFYPIQYSDVSYFIKAIYENELTKGETVDNIAISESKGKYLQINNPVIKKNESVTYNLNIEGNVSYIKVLARFNLYDQKVYYLYNPYQVSKSKGKNEENSGSKKSDDNTLLYVAISIGSVLLIIAIALVIYIFIIKNKNKDLSAQVNKISFVESGAESKEKDKDDGNLLLGNDD